MAHENHTPQSTAGVETIVVGENHGRTQVGHAAGAPETYRPQASGRFAAPLTIGGSSTATAAVEGAAPGVTPGVNPAAHNLHAAGNAPATTTGTAVTPAKAVVSEGEAPEPKASPAARWLVLLLGLLLLALGATMVRDLLIAREVITGQPWLPPVYSWIGSLTWQDWMLWAAIASGVLALLVLWIVLKPRTRTHLPLRAGTDAWMRPSDVARLAATTAEQVHGVLDARATASRKKVTVTATAALDAAQVEARISEAVTRRISVLADPPAVVVRMKNGA